MSTTTFDQRHERRDGFRHEAMLYAGIDGFLRGTLRFIRQGLEAAEPILVVVSAAKIAQLREVLGTDGGLVHFIDMATVGTNPARIIPAWQDFVDRHAPSGQPFRGIGEPIWAERTPDELVECQRHEALLNVAFAGTDWALLCPYDVASLAAPVIEEAQRSHPVIVEDDARNPSAHYQDVDVDVPFDAPLPPPPPSAEIQPFGLDELTQVRATVARWAVRAGLAPARTGDVVFAVNELATNSMSHGGGRGTLRVWQTDTTLVCEVRDGGRITQPLAGRVKPPSQVEGGRGLWLANQLCDLVQVRCFDGGSAVRLHMLRV